jgi:thymidine phosphorylase
VQPEVDDGEVRRLAAVDVEQGDGVEVARIQPPVDLEQLGGVGDEAGVVVGAEVPACASNAVRIAGSLRRFFVGSKKATSVAT